VQNNTVGPWYSQKWQSPIIAFISSYKSFQITTEQIISSRLPRPNFGSNTDYEFLQMNKMTNCYINMIFSLLFSQSQSVCALFYYLILCIFAESRLCTACAMTVTWLLIVKRDLEVIGLSRDTQEFHVVNFEKIFRVQMRKSFPFRIAVPLFLLLKCYVATKNTFFLFIHDLSFVLLLVFLRENPETGIQEKSGVETCELGIRPLQPET